MHHTPARPRRPRASLSLVALALLAVALGACGSGTALNGPTTLQFTGLTPPDADRIEAALRSGNVKYTRKDGPTGTAFQTQSLESAARLGEVHAAVLKAADEDKIEMKFEGATLAYSSLSASGSSLTTITIQASPGAVAYVADQEGRDPWRLIQLDKSGKWQGSVRTRGPVSAQAGWLYAAVTRDEKLYRYLRVNVLTNEQQVTTYAAAQSAGLSEPRGTGRAGKGTPSGATAAPAKPASGDKPADQKSGSGFKWPWES